MIDHPQKILIVEDEADIAEHMQLFLQDAGYVAVHVDDGANVLDAVKRERPDLIVMDVMMPNKDGIACSDEIRGFSNVPIIMVTALGAQKDRLSGLEIGADDYVCKPFDVTELLLRIKAVLRRTAYSVNFTAWHFNEDALEAVYQDTHVTLSALEFALFALLCASPERIYSRDQIIQLAYPDHRDITDRAIDSHVKNIRKKLRAKGIEESPIRSIYGAGYKFSVT